MRGCGGGWGCPGGGERGCPGGGERELAEDTGLARSAYMSSESALLTELLLDDTDDTDDTLLTLRDLRGGRGDGVREATHTCGHG